MSARRQISDKLNAINGQGYDTFQSYRDTHVDRILDLANQELTDTALRLALKGGDMNRSIIEAQRELDDARGDLKLFKSRLRMYFAVGVVGVLMVVAGAVLALGLTAFIWLWIAGGVVTAGGFITGLTERYSSEGLSLWKSKVIRAERNYEDVVMAA